jgi:RIO kinase 1
LDTEWIDAFVAEGFVKDVLMRLKSGKEASVFLCRGDVASACELVAAKYYRPRLGRGFQNRAIYQQGRGFGGSRDSRAVANKSRFGRAIEEGRWIDHEFDMLCRLHAAGADVPRPIATHGDAILMEFVGSEDGPAARLREVELEAREAGRLFERLMWNIERFLANHVVHGDLSDYNILIQAGEATIIDFPQAVDPRCNASAQDLLRRDIRNVCAPFERFGGRANPDILTDDLWARYIRARL